MKKKTKLVRITDKNTPYYNMVGKIIPSNSILYTIQFSNHMKIDFAPTQFRRIWKTVTEKK